MLLIDTFVTLWKMCGNEFCRLLTKGRGTDLRTRWKSPIWATHAVASLEQLEAHTTVQLLDRSWTVVPTLNRVETSYIPWYEYRERIQRLCEIGMLEWIYLVCLSFSLPNCVSWERAKSTPLTTVWRNTFPGELQLLSAASGYWGDIRLTQAPWMQWHLDGPEPQGRYKNSSAAEGEAEGRFSCPFPGTHCSNLGNENFPSSVSWIWFWILSK